MDLSEAERIIFWFLSLCALSVSCRRIYALSRLIRTGKKGGKLDRIGARTKATLNYVLGQSSILKSVAPGDLAGFGHFFIFWGAIVFAINYFVFFFLGEGLGVSDALRNTAASHYFLWLSDMFGLLLIAAIFSAVVRRCIIKPPRLGPGFDSGIFLVLTFFIFVLFVCYFSLEGLRIHLGTTPFRAPVAGAFADLFGWTQIEEQALTELFRTVWWTQFFIVLGFIIYVPYSHHSHPLFSPFNVFFKSFDPIGAIKPVDFEKEMRFGASRGEDFTRKQLLEGFACAHCGRCQDACPAHLTHKPLSPKSVVLDVKKHLLETGTREKQSDRGLDSLTPAVHTEGILSCTTCGACIEVCPVLNRPLDQIIELRRNLVYEGTFDRGHQTALKRVAQDSNPWGVRWHNRAKNIDIEIAEEGKRYDCIYWLGCAAAFDETAREIAEATVRILKAAGLEFAMLGVNEKCCGDFVRRIGDEGLFQELAAANIRELDRLDFDFILTHCPHCFNSLKNEYQDFGGSFEVYHHTQLIHNLLREKKIDLHRSEYKILYFDPCYLGRYNQIYEKPREVLRRIFGQSLEFPRCREKSFCCGAGGGHMWKEEEDGTRISAARAQEAIAANPQFVATACPFCLLMFDEALQIEGKQDAIKVKDIAQIAERFL